MFHLRRNPPTSLPREPDALESPERQANNAAPTEPAGPTEGVRLHQLPPKLCGQVQTIDADHEDADRLKAMGVCVGRRVEVLRRGDPLILRVLGSRIGVSSRLAKCVVVQVCEAPECQPPA